MKRKNKSISLKEKFFFWIAQKIHDDLVSNGFVHEDDFTDYFDNEIEGNNYVSDYDLSQAVDNAVEDLENTIYEIEDNVQDVHDRLEKVEQFLKNRYGLGKENEGEGY